MSLKSVMGEKSTISVRLRPLTKTQMYRDCLKTVKHMTQDPKAQRNIALHFRMEFEK